MSWSSAYHRVSDDSVSSYGGHETQEAAVHEAAVNIKDADIDQVWVRNPAGAVVWGLGFTPAKVGRLVDVSRLGPPRRSNPQPRV